MRCWLLALLLTAAGAAAAATGDALNAIDDCLGQLDPALDVGYERIAQRCPDLGPSLAASPWAPWLPRNWNEHNNTLSAGGLQELRTLLTRPAPVAGVPAPRVERVAAVLAALAPNERPRGGWWARFKQWLREILSPRPVDPGQAWWRRLIGGLSLSQALRQAILWGALALVVALVGAIVINELRVAGLLRRRPRRTFRSGAVPYSPARLSLEQVEQASPGLQPRLLLEVIVARLREQERLPPARALTLHELQRAARLPAHADRERLAALTAACERVRFAAQEVPAAMLTAALARGRELLAALEALPPGAGSQDDACASA
jgi:hypothetical protein